MLRFARGHRTGRQPCRARAWDTYMLCLSSMLPSTSTPPLSNVGTHQHVAAEPVDARLPDIPIKKATNSKCWHGALFLQAASFKKITRNPSANSRRLGVLGVAKSGMRAYACRAGISFLREKRKKERQTRRERERECVSSTLSSS